jgi:hypothetical protein
VQDLAHQLECRWDGRSFFSRGGQRTPPHVSEPPLPPVLPLRQPHGMHGVQNETSGPSLLSESWQQRPSGAAKFRRNCGDGRPPVLGLGHASRWCEESPPFRRSRVAHLKYCYLLLIRYVVLNNTKAGPRRWMHWVWEETVFCVKEVHLHFTSQLYDKVLGTTLRLRRLHDLRPHDFHDFTTSRLTTPRLLRLHDFTTYDLTTFTTSRLTTSRLSRLHDL